MLVELEVDVLLLALFVEVAEKRLATSLSMSGALRPPLALLVLLLELVLVELVLLLVPNNPLIKLSMFGAP